MRTKKVLDVTNSKSITKLIKYFEDYKKSLPDKCRLLCDKLADIGVKAALVSTVGNGFADYVLFSKECKIQNSDETVVIMFGKDLASIQAEDGSGRDISPILMMEYGSGAFANPQYKWGIGESGDTLIVGRGSFPDQQHAFDPNGWWYKSTRDGEWHHSFGVHPQYPMQHAYDLMQTQVDKIIREVFKL